MKKKLAILLSALMVISPLTVFADSRNELTNAPTLVVGKTLFMEDGYTNDGMTNLKVAGRDPVTGSPTDVTTSDIEYVVEGTTASLEITSGNLVVGRGFKVGLDNAKWFFRHSAGIVAEADTAQLRALLMYVADFRITSDALENGDVVYGTTGATSYTVGDLLATDVINVGASPSSYRFEIYGKNGASSEFARNLFNTIVAAVNPTVSGTSKEELFLLAFARDILNAEDGITVRNGELKLDGEQLLTNGSLSASARVGGTGVTHATLGFTYNGAKVPTASDKFGTSGLLTAIATAVTVGSGYVHSATTGEVTTYDVEKGIFFPSLPSSTSGTYVRFASGYDTGASAAVTLSSTVLPAYFMNIDSNDEVGTVHITAGNGSNAVLTTNTSDGSGNIVVEIPLVTRSLKEGDVRVDIAYDANTTPVKKESILFGQAGKNNTEASVKSTTNAKFSFPIDELKISEKVPNSIQPGYVIIEAPDGFAFTNPTSKFSSTVDGHDYVWMTANETLLFAGGVREYKNTPAETAKIQYYKDKDGNPVTNKLVVDLAGLQTSSRTNGNIVIHGLVLQASDNAPMDQDVVLTVRERDGDIKHETGNYGRRSYVSTSNVVIGTRKDWGVKFERLTDVKTLVNGRFSPVGTADFNNDHQTARVRFSENIVASWWALRESEFTLTEGAKFMQVKITEQKNFDHARTGITTLNDTYEPKADKQGYIFMSANTLRIVDLEIERDKSSSFEMQPWISIESGFEGDIELMAGGNEIMKECEPVVIAKAVSPITVTAEVTSVKIGYQWQKVADFKIEETAPGRLKRNTTMVIGIDDEITGSDNISFGPDFVLSTNADSNMQITKPVIAGGEITFNIERVSYRNAAVFSFSEVYVKIDRTVPESNKQPYKIVAGGDAVAANFYANVNTNGTVGTGAKLTKLDNYIAVFSVKGIGTALLDVVTSADDKDSILSQVVWVEIGSDVVVKGRDKSESLSMDTAAYISTKTNSTMVPVRFIANAFGIDAGQIAWDNGNRTVTIYNGGRVVQFKVDTSEITVNGVTSTMYNNAFEKVYSEIKDDRTFLPFRHLGYALGVAKVGWDDETKTAVYNYQLLENSDPEYFAKLEASNDIAYSTDN